MPPVPSADKLLTHAKLATKNGDWLAAQGHYKSVLDRFPKNKRARQGLDALRPKAVPALLKSAQTAQTNGDWAQAETLLTAAASLAPTLPEIALALGACCLEMGRAHGALRAVEPVLRTTPDHPGALNIKGSALREMGRGHEAEVSLRAALGNRDSDARTLNNLGILARAQGDRTAAAGHYRQAIAQTPNDPALHRNLAHATTYSGTSDNLTHLEQMQKLVGDMRPSDPAAAPLHFALFKALDDLGHTDAAFGHLEAGNRLIKTAQGYDFKTDAVPHALTKVLFGAGLPAAKQTSGITPIFVTGLPRSGTTLTERILSQAEGVQACGELTVVQVAVGRLLREVMARDHKALTSADIEALRRVLLDALAEYSDGSPFLVDKMPLNFRWISFICAALPEAKIVHIDRDPMAVAWSLYRHSFAGAGNGFVYDVADIARFMVLHRDCLAHWRGHYPDRIHGLNYADLVTDPETTTRALAAGVDLPWSTDWLSPEKATSHVLTASAEQARQPIYTNSDQGWTRYEAHLAPLHTALRAAGVIEG